MLFTVVALVAAAAFLCLIEDQLRGAWSAFRLAFWKEFHRVRQQGAMPTGAVTPSLVTEPGLGVEPLQTEPAPLTWPDEREWASVAIECPTCGDSFVPMTTAFLIEHANEGLICPFCSEPTGQQIRYEATS